MARAWYTTERFRTAAISAGIFLAVLVLIFLSSKIPGVNRFYARLEAGGVRLGTQLGGFLRRASESEESLTSAYQTCQETTRALAIDKSQLAALEREVEELRALHNYAELSATDGILARITARGVADDATSVIIDQGFQAGITEGSAVIIDNGVIFGLVTDANDYSAVVRLLSSPQSNLPATILGDNRSLGLVEGREGSLLVMEFIPQEAEIQVNDVVVTTGLDGLIPAGLVIGLISDVVSDDSSPFKRAFVEPQFSASDWTTVYVIPAPHL